VESNRLVLRKIISAIIVIPLLIVIVGFAVANRQAITISFDPFSSAQPAYSLTLPLFILIFVVLIVGVITGGVAAWTGQRVWRRTARRLDAEVRNLRSELDSARTQSGRAPERPNPPLVVPPIS
jgi:uncharacterized integral membrane protein